MRTWLMSVGLLCMGALSMAQTAVCPSVLASASTSTIHKGRSVKITWAATNAAHVNISPGHEGLPRFGSLVVAPQQTTDFHVIAIAQPGVHCPGTAHMVHVLVTVQP